MGLSGIHGLEDAETGFASSSFDGELFRVFRAVAGVELERDVVLSAGQGKTGVRDGIGQGLPVSGVRFFREAVGYADR